VPKRKVIARNTFAISSLVWSEVCKGRNTKLTRLLNRLKDPDPPRLQRPSSSLPSRRMLQGVGIEFPQMTTSSIVSYDSQVHYHHDIVTQSKPIMECIVTRWKPKTSLLTSLRYVWPQTFPPTDVHHRTRRRAGPDYIQDYRSA
jgi:hypothetical protein